MDVNVTWRRISGDRDPLWEKSRSLYAYFRGKKPLYIGKAEEKTVRQRFTAGDKANLFDWLADQHKLSVDSFDVLVGIPQAEAGRRVTYKVLRDLDSLLIYRLRPVGNIKGIMTIGIRRQLRVFCNGAWPLARAAFRNIGSHPAEVAFAIKHTSRTPQRDAQILKSWIG